MNWYKTAKIRDMSQDLMPQPVICDICKRWGTINENGDHTWKYYYEMTPEEQEQVNAIKGLSGGATKFQNEICDYCRKKMS